LFHTILSGNSPLSEEKAHGSRPAPPDSRQGGIEAAGGPRQVRAVGAAGERTRSGQARLEASRIGAEREKSVGELQRIVGISQSALSQHLATLRAKKLVAVRREAQTIYYRLNGPEVAAVLTTLYSLYCGPGALVCGIDAAGI
jgi:DNA-binding transcriptional ArsR family regulator